MAITGKILRSVLKKFMKAEVAQERESPSGITKR
jgi:hypothetical protein